MITFNTKSKDLVLSNIAPRQYAQPEVCLTPFGKMTEKYILRIPDVYQNVILDNYVIMPDHVHLLLTLQSTPDYPEKAKTNIASIIRSTKTMINKELGQKIWQLDFYDVIADTQDLFDRCDRYIDHNPAAWLDKHIEPFRVK